MSLSGGESGLQAATTQHAVPLRIQLLGGFRVTLGDTLVPDSAWRTRKARSLLKLLCLAPGYRLHREAVLDLLWPEFDPEAAANNLRSTLHFARRALQPEGIAAPRPLLRVHGDVLILGAGGDVSVDAEAFTTAAATARRTGESTDIETAVALYSGELLPEDRYEDWAAVPRETLRQIWIELLVMLAGLHETRGAYGTAIEQLERVVANDLTHEDAHAGLMRLHALSGRHGQALRQYERLTETLASELDVEPSLTTRRLHADIAAGRFPPAGVTSRAHTGTPPARGSRRSSRQHNLPAPLTSFIGRHAEIADIRRLLSSTRLLTLTGTGGSGKTRLALEVARAVVGDFEHGVWLVELASAEHPALIPHAIAAATGVREQAGRELIETLAEALHGRKMLLVLDNCEHLIEGCASVAQRLLAACPDMRILATSREALRVPGEVVWRAPSLPLPPATATDGTALMHNDAVALFVDRVRLVRPSFVLADEDSEAVIQICRQLDGLPLALELAAARASVLDLRQLAARLDDALRLLSSGSRTAPSRQQTLEATLDWSYQLLDAGEQALLRRLSVFAGGWTLEAAEAVCNLPLHDTGPETGERLDVQQADVLPVLARLVDKSLVQVDDGSVDAGLRYRLLETIRQYATRQLIASGGAEQSGEQHAAYYLALAEEAEPAFSGSEQAFWLNRLEREHDNLRAALRWFVEHGDIHREALLCSALARFWYFHGHITEGDRWLSDVLDRLRDGDVPDIVLARTYQGAGALAWNRGDAERSEALSSEALRLFESGGNLVGVADTLHALGVVAELHGDYETGTQRYEAALRLREQLGDTVGAATTLHNLGNIAREQHQPARATTLYERSLALQREAENTRGVALALSSLGVVALDTHNYAAAEQLSIQARNLYEQLGLRSMAFNVISNIGYAVLFQGDAKRAVWHQTECLRIAMDLGNKRAIAYGLEGIAGAVASSDAGVAATEQAVRLFGAAEMLRETIRVPLPPADQILNEPAQQAAEQILGQTAFHAAWLAGRATTPEAAMREAMSLSALLAPEEPAPVTGVPQPSLSRREQEVALLVARGQTNRQIAAELGMATRTVDTHVSSLLRKLRLRSRADVAAWAATHHVTPPDPAEAG